MSPARDLPPCPGRPNCISSRAVDPRHRIQPFRIAGDPDAAWSAIHDCLARWPRTRIVEASPEYLRAECRTRFLRFTDDLELALDREAGLVHLRSSARIDYTDFGVNRRRAEAIRRRLVREGVLSA
ncbi:MAG: DUF1499 domain-containing protein [Acidobacteriota bacterium]|jgi:uncharacterized protein (DUF1499 family)